MFEETRFSSTNQEYCPRLVQREAMFQTFNPQEFTLKKDSFTVKNQMLLVPTSQEKLLQLHLVAPCWTRGDSPRQPGCRLFQCLEHLQGHILGKKDQTSFYKWVFPKNRGTPEWMVYNL